MLEPVERHVVVLPRDRFRELVLEHRLQEGPRFDVLAHEALQPAAVAQRHVVQHVLHQFVSLAALAAHVAHVPHGTIA
jgi:hypothetical protein